MKSDSRKVTQKYKTYSDISGIVYTWEGAFLSVLKVAHQPYRVSETDFAQYFSRVEW